GFGIGWRVTTLLHRQGDFLFFPGPQPHGQAGSRVSVGHTQAMQQPRNPQVRRTGIADIGNVTRNEGCHSRERFLSRPGPDLVYPRAEQLGVSRRRLDDVQTISKPPCLERQPDERRKTSIDVGMSVAGQGNNPRYAHPERNWIELIRMSDIAGDEPVELFGLRAGETVILRLPDIAQELQIPAHLRVS